MQQSHSNLYVIFCMRAAPRRPGGAGLVRVILQLIPKINIPIVFPAPPASPARPSARHGPYLNCPYAGGKGGLGLHSSRGAIPSCCRPRCWLMVELGCRQRVRHKNVIISVSGTADLHIIYHNRYYIYCIYTPYYTTTRCLRVDRSCSAKPKRCTLRKMIDTIIIILLVRGVGHRVSTLDSTIITRTG